MKKNLGKGKKIVAAILICALLLAVAAFSFTELPFSAAKIEGTKDYSHAIASVEGITTANPRVIDIAMLGSHDSFTNDIVWNSPVDPDAIGGIEMQTPVKELIWGISRRYAVTQTLDAYDQLRAGARYLDIRLSWFEEEYYTKHGFISAPFQKQAEQILRFLADNKGEVIILNFQQMHFFNQRTNDNFFAALSLIKVEGRSFFDYVPYKTIGVDATPLWELRYNELTDSGTKSGLVILCKDDRNDDNEIPFGSKFTQIYRYYDETFGDYREQYTPIRSLWLNTNSNAELFDGVDKEAEFIKENWSKYSKMVRVNQSQKTMQLGSAKGFLNTAIDWSLLNAAENLNPKLLAHEGFAERLAVMPIFQVDFVNSSKKDFNNKVNAVILDFNNKLCAA